MDGTSGLSLRAERLANRILGIGIAWIAAQTFFALHLGRSPRIVGAATLVLLAALVVRLRTSTETRLRVALLLVPFVLAVHVFELRMVWKRPPPATAAALAGRAWDGRSLGEVIDDVRKEGRSAAPVVQPKPIIQIEKGPLRNAAGDILPLGGLAGDTTIFCNESGAWVSYEADEHGFVNPRGAMGAPSTEIALIGDSFTQGACVKTEESHAGLIRARHPSLVNLGMGGNGPLLELAGIREYAARFKPRRVLWFYFRNDLDDLDVERDVPLLMRYLDPSFSQRLFDRRPEVEAALRDLVARHTRYSKRWPGALGAVGLTRARMPVLVQDLVLAERNSAGSALLRLDGLTSLLEFKSGRRPPDFALFKAVLARAKADVAAWGGELTFVYLPDLWFSGKKINAHPLRERVLGVVREVGLPLVDVDVPFNREPDLEALRYHPDAHTNPAGYAVIARVVNAHLDGLPR